MHLLWNLVSMVGHLFQNSTMLIFIQDDILSFKMMQLSVHGSSFPIQVSVISVQDSYSVFKNRTNRLRIEAVIRDAYFRSRSKLSLQVQ